MELEAVSPQTMWTYSALEIKQASTFRLLAEWLFLLKRLGPTQRCCPRPQVDREAGFLPWHFLLQAKIGLLVGILEPLPRAPHVFATGEVAAREHAMGERGSDYYGSTRDRLDFAKAKFENTAVATLAIIVEEEKKDKKRLIHDATHSVRVNHRITRRDKLKAPEAREKKQLLLEAMDRKEMCKIVCE